MFYRLQPVLVFIVVTTVGMLTVAASWYTIDQANRMAFLNIAEETAQRVSGRVENHMLLIKSVEAYFEAADRIPDIDAFQTFIETLRKTEQFDGVQGIGFARYVITGSLSDRAISAELDQNYGTARTPWPETGEEHRTPIVMLEPATEANHKALAYDMYSEPTRRAAILAALSEQRLRASGPVELVQEDLENPQAGFLIYTPFFAANTGLPLGFIYAPFRIPNLFESALHRAPLLPVHVKAWDRDQADSQPIYESPEPASSRFGAPPPSQQLIEVAGRTWTLEISPADTYRPAADQTRTIMLAIASLLLAAALAASSRAQQRTIEVGEALRQHTEQALTEREMLLQEMKHRIKNMIARVMAISRQTARASENLDDFANSFGARLQAMAASQDLLARTAWRSADLETLLVQELKQLFGDDLAQTTVSGPRIELNETAAQAFGLAFHELATNALKYGSAQAENGELAIRWRLEENGDNQDTLVFTWRERGSKALDQQNSDGVAKKGGFGTKLLDATMRRELGGSITIAPDEFGIDVTISVPKQQVLAKHGPESSSGASSGHRKQP